MGNGLLTVNGPLSGTDDTTRYRYDDGRQLVGVVGPDPDGGSALKHRALRLTYNPDGQVTLAEQGTVDSQSDGDWAAFVSLQQQTTGYDFLRRPVLRTMTANSATHAVVQLSYDTMGRLDCTALRLNPAMFAALPASACTLGAAGADGPDRIARNTYDDASRLSEVTLGYGTPAAVDEWSATFTDNGQLATLADASGNLTTYEYDGFNRLARIRFPNTSGGGSSTTDDELYAYNAASAVTVVTRRDGATLTTAYDNLMRPTSVTPSANGAAIGYTYDNFGRVLTAGISGHTLTYGYDQLSRTLSQQSPLGTVAYQYDLANRRTRITWPDSFCAQYAYDLYAAVTQISAEGGSCNTTTLASYGYDNLGRRVSVSRGNGVTTAYGFDSAERLDEIAHDLAGSSQDETIALGYNAVGQIVSRTGSDADYAWTPLAPATTSYADNGLNQYTSVGGVSQAHDARGNLTTGSFSYDIHNNLTAGPSSATLAYDPALRLHETVGGGVTTRFLYDGAQAIAEYNGSNQLQRRFIPGPALDEPVAWYEGSGTSDRRWLIADERGSVIAITNASGAATTINTYDEYGIPAGTNAGRFQYTGQMWLPEVARYHYRARAYAPTTGRFQQSDPILTAGGMNLYAYVANDPVNLRDPFGLAKEPPIIVTAQRIDPCGNIRGCVSDLRSIVDLMREYTNQTTQDSAGERGEDDNAQQCPTDSEATTQQAQFFRTLPRTLFARPPVLPPTGHPSVPYPTSPNLPPGPGWVPRGPNWFNPRTGESLHPDLNHPPGIAPHWDFHLRPGPHGPGGSWRWFPDNSFQPKAAPPILPLPGAEGYQEASC